MPFGYVRTDFVWASRMPFTTWWYVDPKERIAGVGSALLLKTRQALAKAGFDRWLISSCRPNIIEHFEHTCWAEIGTIQLSAAEKEVWFEKDISGSHHANQL